MNIYYRYPVTLNVRLVHIILKEILSNHDRGICQTSYTITSIYIYEVAAE